MITDRKNQNNIETATLNYIFRKGSSTQDELISHLGASQPSVSRVLQNMKKRGLLEITFDKKNNLRGRKRQIAQLSAKAGSWVGCELTSQGYDIVLIDMKSRVIGSSHGKWQSKEPAEILSQLASEIQRVHGSTLKQNPSVKGIGILIRGKISDDTVRASNTFPEIIDYPIKKELSEKLNGTLVHVAPMGICHMYAEIRESFEEFNNSDYPIVLIYWWKGIILCVMTNRNILLHGASANYPLVEYQLPPGWDFSHIVIDKDGEKCICGRKGCVEATVNSEQMGRELRELLDLSKDDNMSDSQLIQKGVSLAESDEEVFSNFFENKIMAILKPANTIFQLMSTHKIVLGGWIFNENPWVFNKFVELTRKSLPDDLAESILFEKSKIGNDAAALGAAELVFHTTINHYFA
jgi:predicted NBD/HSP70 family sugar kinase